jgi:hypothetical protein
LSRRGKIEAVIHLRLSLAGLLLLRLKRALGNIVQQLNFKWNLIVEDAKLWALPR